MAWIWLVLLYGIIKGTREIVKKKALEKNSTIEVLFIYTLIAFLLVLPDAKNAVGLELKYYFFIWVKAFAIFLAWMFSFKAISKMPISLYGVLDLSRVLFATLLGVVVLNETLGIWQVFGLILVSSGLLLLKYRPKAMGRKSAEHKVQGCEQKSEQDYKQSSVQVNEQEHRQEQAPVETKLVIMAFASCLLNAVSGLLDKLLMKDINSSQLQFWYLFFLALMYIIFILATRTKVHMGSAVKNYWIWILSILIVVADRALFLANGIEGSRITVMTLLKQSGSVVAILGGRFIFHEKNIGHKLVCAAIIIAGIVMSVI